MSFPFTVSAAALRNVRPFTSTEESRPILNGILIEASGAMCATNGHVLLARAPGHPDDEMPPARDVIVRLDKAVPRWAEWATVTDVDDVPTHHEVALVVKVWNEKGKVDYISAKEIPGPFPNWRAVMPRTASATASLPPVDPRYLERFAVEGCETVRFFAGKDPERPVRVVFAGRPEYVGLLMPKLCDEWSADSVPDLPSFTEHPQADTAAAA